MTNKKTVFFLIIIVFFSFILRIYEVGSKPSGILPDEASFGYNAYSVLKTGKDEHGIPYPLIFKAFGDQKLPAYAYSLLPSIKFLGLNNLAVRMPSVIFGIFITVSIFFLLIELGFSQSLSLFGSLISATSPWSIILSRFAFESNLGLLFFILGIIFAFKSIKKNNILFFFLTGLFLGLTWYSYIAFRLTTTLMLISFLVIYSARQKKINLRNLVIIISFIVVAAPFLFSLISNQGKARLNQASLNSNLGMVLEINESRNFCTQYLPKIICYLNANKAIAYGKNLFYRYINTFSPDYLFLNGDKNSKYINVDNFGLFPVILLPFYFLGFIYLWNKFTSKSIIKNELFLIIGFIIAPMPSLLVGDPQKVRLSGLFPFLIILVVYGLDYFTNLLKKSINKKIFSLTITTLLIVSSLFFMINLLTIHVQKYEIAYETYVPKLMTYLGRFDKKTDIYIRSITEAPILFAYVNKVDPEIFQKTVVRKNPDAIGFIHATDLNNLHITERSIEAIYCQTKNNNNQILYIINEDFVKVGKVKKAKKIIWSENHVDTLAFIYDIKDVYAKSIDCNFFK